MSKKRRKARKAERPALPLTEAAEKEARTCLPPYLRRLERAQPEVWAQLVVCIEWLVEAISPAMTEEVWREGHGADGALHRLFWAAYSRLPSEARQLIAPSAFKQVLRFYWERAFLVEDLGEEGTGMTQHLRGAPLSVRRGLRRVLDGFAIHQLKALDAHATRYALMRWRKITAEGPAPKLDDLKPHPRDIQTDLAIAAGQLEDEPGALRRTPRKVVTTSPRCEQPYRVRPREHQHEGEKVTEAAIDAEVLEQLEAATDADSVQYIDLVERIAAHLDAQGDVAGLAELAYLRGRLEGGAETRRTVLAAWPGAGSTEAMRAALPRIRAAVRACA